MDGIFGLAALGFWLYVAAAAVGGIWDGVRKRDAEHETLRRIIESGKTPDQQLINKLLGTNKAPERDLKVAGLIVLFVAPGLAAMGWFIGLRTSSAFMPIFGAAVLVGFVGIGLLVAAQYMARARREEDQGNNNPFG
jgi:cbb3-type cytochrome oxidase subunit 1